MFRLIIPFGWLSATTSRHREPSWPARFLAPTRDGCLAAAPGAGLVDGGITTVFIKAGTPSTAAPRPEKPLSDILRLGERILM
ncbi:MAG: hypothetical protein IV100_13155 [Myxococcales bacterium]|nr:hypothetical protein [Myxococcales bacterium]